VEATGILQAVVGTPVYDLVGPLRLAKANVNLSTPADTHWAHDHRNQIVLLYYVNKHWKHEWAGETLFYNDDLSEVECASIYKPGRIVVFDGEIPHTIRPQSINAPVYRFTLSLFFDKNV
jgi:Rps23 Pro-64 3,4-dihydroxylase Tpa1-like proline 4-hydroxylase